MTVLWTNRFKNCIAMLTEFSFDSHEFMRDELSFSPQEKELVFTKQIHERQHSSGNKKVRVTTS